MGFVAHGVLDTVLLHQLGELIVGQEHGHKFPRLAGLLVLDLERAVDQVFGDYGLVDLALL